MGEFCNIWADSVMNIENCIIAYIIVQKIGGYIMRIKVKIFATFLSLVTAFALVWNPISVMAAEDSKVQIVDFAEDENVTIIQLSDEEVAELLEYANNCAQTRIENQVYAMPVKVDANRVAVDFTNVGFLFDRVDYVETNLIIWHAQDNNPVGYRLTYTHLPVGTYRSEIKYVAGWHSAQAIGGYYIDGFGQEVGIGGASSVIYN